MITIIGLGNPGSDYEETRHNVGFMVVEAISRTLEAEFEAGKGDYLVTFSEYRGKRIALVKPLAYMNNSGLALVDLVDRYDIDLKDMLVICDDFNLPLGRIRLRPKGSDGGHNGLYSIIYHLQTDEFARLRCGIGRPVAPGEKFDSTRFVLSVFDKAEKTVVKKMIAQASEAALCFASEGLRVAMDRWNAAGKS